MKKRRKDQDRSKKATGLEEGKEMSEIEIEEIPHPSPGVRLGQQ